MVPILYGLYSPRIPQEVRDGRAVLGGCMPGRSKPDWHCKACLHEWYDPMDSEREARWEAYDRWCREIDAQFEEKSSLPQQPTGAPSGVRG